MPCTYAERNHLQGHRWSFVSDHTCLVIGWKEQVRRACSMQSATEGEVWWVIESPTPFASTGCTNASKAKRNAIIISGKPNEACVNCMVDMVSAMRTRQMCRAEEYIGARMERERKKQRLVSVWNYRLVMWKRKESETFPTQTPPSLSPSLLPSLPLSCSSRSSAFYAYSIPTMPTYGWQARRDAPKNILQQAYLQWLSVFHSTRRKGLHERLSVFL